MCLVPKSTSCVIFNGKLLGIRKRLQIWLRLTGSVARLKRSLKASMSRRNSAKGGGASVSFGIVDGNMVCFGEEVCGVDTWRQMSTIFKKLY